MVALQMDVMEDAPAGFPRANRRRFTRRSLHLMVQAGILDQDDRVELIDGEVIDMSPIGLRHQECVDLIDDFLPEQVRRHIRLRVQGPLVIGEHTELYPDVMLLQRRSYAQEPATPQDVFVAIEVADSSLQHDRNIKAPQYAAAGIREVWIIDLKANLVLQHTEPVNGRYRKIEQLAAGDVIETTLLPELSLSFNVSDILP